MEPSLRPIVKGLYRAIYERVGYDRVAAKAEHVAWRLARDGWMTMRQCSVTLYAPGCVRFRNDLSFGVPKKIWPFEPVSYGLFGKMEVTIHETEVTDLLPLLIEMAEDARHEYKSEHFPKGVVTPHYCWSTKAHAEYEAQKAARKMRQFR